MDRTSKQRFKKWKKKTTSRHIYNPEDILEISGAKYEERRRRESNTHRI